jgi:hypothetical protein
LIHDYQRAVIVKNRFDALQKTKTNSVMKKTSLRQVLVFLIILMAAFGCEQEAFNSSAAGCGGCPIEPPPGGGTIEIYCPDIVVYSVISYGRVGNVIKYGVVIKNIGNTTAYISNTNLVGWQAWLSTNGVTRNVAACGSSFNQQLAPGQLSTPVQINCTFPTSVNFSLYRSMIVDLHVPAAIGECSTSNNTFVRTPVP